MNKLSELSKPEAYVFDHGVMGPGDFKYGTPQMHSTAKDENARPLYSQEYVSALLAELEGMELTLNVANDATRIWKERALAAEAKLATPVQLPVVLMGYQSDDYRLGFMEGVEKSREEVRSASFTVEGAE